MQLLPMMLLTALFLGCVQSDTQTHSVGHEIAPKTVTLSEAYESPLSLLEAVIDAASRSDVEALAALRVSYEEHEKLLWPAFPASDPSFNIPHDFAWSNLMKGCLRGQRHLVDRLGGGDWNLVDFGFDSTEEYGEFRLHLGTRVLVESPSGRRVEINAIGSVVEFDGRFKLLSYQEP